VRLHKTPDRGVLTQIERGQPDDQGEKQD